MSIIPPVDGYDGWYAGDSWASVVAGRWTNKASPGTNDITSTSGTIAASIDTFTGQSYVYGGTTATLTLPFVPATSSSPYTFFHVAKYNGVAKQRIFQGKTFNWLSGYWQGNSGVAYHNNWVTATTSVEYDLTTWLLSADRPTNFRANMVDKTTLTVAASADQIAVNTGNVAAEASDWAISEMIYYTRTLSDAEVILVERYLNEKYRVAPTAALPSSGSISLADMRATFPGVTSPFSLLSYAGVHPSGPTESPNLLAFRGLNAVSPVHAAATVYDTGASGTAKATAALTASGLAVSTTGGGTLPLSLNLASYLTNSALQGTMKYSVSKGRDVLPTGVTLNTTTGVLTVDPALVNPGTSALSYTRDITVTNKWGNASTLAVTFNFGITITGLVLKLDADTHTAGSSTWLDASGSGYNFTINPSALQSTGTLKFMDFSGSYGIAQRATDVPAYPFSTVVCFTAISSATSDWRTLLRSISTAQYHQLLVSTTGVVGEWCNGAHYPSNINISSIANVSTAFNMWVMRYAQTSPYLELSVNTSTVRTTLTNSATSFTKGFAYIGGNGGQPVSQFWGKIGALLYYNKRLSDADINSIYSSNKVRFNLP